MARALRPHIPFLVSVLLLVAVGFGAMNNQNNLLFWVFGVIAGALIVSLVLSHLMIRSLDVRRLDPKHGVVGEPMILRYAVTNRSRWLPVLNLHVEELPESAAKLGRRILTLRRTPSRSSGGTNWHRFMKPAASWIMHVGPGETVHGEMVMWPRARGEVTFGHLQYWTTFPFGIVRRSRRRRQPTHTLIFPRLYGLKRGVIDAIVPAGPLGMKLSPRPGGGDDYFGLREYRPGDSRRHIAWKRSAGSEALIITERTLPSPPRIRIVLNLSAPTIRIQHDAMPRVSARALEERAISLTASFIYTAYVRGYEIGLSVLGFDIPVTPLRQSHWHVEKIMGALASINLDSRRLPADARALADAERVGMAIVHPGRVDPSIARVEGWHFSAMQLTHLAVRVPEPEVLAAMSDRELLGDGYLKESKEGRPAGEEAAA